MNTGLLLFATVFAGTLYLGEAIRCYSCMYSTTFDSMSDPNCNEGSAFGTANTTGNLAILECNGQCSKQKGKIGSAVTIRRTCSSTCIEVIVGGLGNACCKTDLCNAAWRMAATTPVLALTLAIALLMAGVLRG